MKSKIKTPISYYGGKQAIISHILPLIPEHDLYTESFFGGGTVFFAKDPVKNETINDRLDIVINFYRVLKTKYKALKVMIDLSLISRTMHTHCLFICKGRVPADDVTRAWAFWYCSNFSFANKIGGGMKYANEMNTLVTLTLLNKKKSFTEELCSRIEHTSIENGDALKVLQSRNTKTAFHYIDTPYPGADQGQYAGYGWNDLDKVLAWCGNECKGNFLLSNYNSDLLTDCINQYGWHKTEITHRLKAPRKSGPTKTEVLVHNYIIKPATVQMQIC